MAEALPYPLGPYQLVELIGRGGMAEVFRARRDGPGGFVKDLALKRILPHYSGNEQLIGRFMEEARIAGALVHGNVVQVYDFGLVDGHYFIVMEYIDGMSLATVLDLCVASGIPLPSPLVAFIGAEVCSGLAFAHGLSDPSGRPVDVVHRDVSPQNVMLSYAGDVKIGDFGIVKVADSMIRTDVGLRLGKTSYMSPEQAAGDPLDGRSDLFALGVTLWEALTLKPLLPRGDPARTLEVLSTCEFPRVTDLAPDVHPELAEVVTHALARSRDDRYPDGEAMARRLRAYVHHSSPGFGRHDLVEYLDWLRPDGSRPSTLGPPHPVPVPPTSPPGQPDQRASRARRLWPWLALAAAPLLGIAAGAGTFAALHLLLGYEPAPQVPAPAPPVPTVTAPTPFVPAPVLPTPPSAGTSGGSVAVDPPLAPHHSEEAPGLALPDHGPGETSPTGADRRRKPEDERPGKRAPRNR